MDNNDLLRRLRYALRCDDANTSRLIQLGGGAATTAQVGRWRAKEDAAEYEPCGSEDVASFLSGLIVEYRGPRDEPAASPWPDRSSTNRDALGSSAQPSQYGQTAEQAKTGKTQANAGMSNKADQKKTDQIDNNLVLKQLRIALSLRSDDVHRVLKAGGSAMSESEAGALFRKPDARNYRKCGDQVLRQFISGLVKRREQENDQVGNTGSGKAGASKSSSSKSGSSKSGSGKSGSSKSGSSKSGSSKSGSGKSGSGKSGLGKPGSGKSGSGKSGSGKPGSGKPGSGKPGSGKPGSGKPGSGKPGSGKPGSSKPGSSKPGSRKADSRKADSSKSGAGKPSLGKPGLSKSNAPNSVRVKSESGKAKTLRHNLSSGNS